MTSRRPLPPADPTRPDPTRDPVEQPRSTAKPPPITMDPFPASHAEFLSLLQQAKLHAHQPSSSPSAASFPPSRCSKLTINDGGFMQREEASLPEGEPDEDSLQFMKEYYDAVTTIRLRELTEDQLRMRCFPYCMKDEAKKWLLALPAGSLITWEAVETKFFSRYYPAWKTREIRGNIATFEEEPGKAFHETWD
ncbi:hypothetical protein LWI29_004977 [Acer saccharum]|uniref:Retrotransposon gag domain-containing protein n=1 Tax=Acer saccharum TaxID=4024 RepID=A0AA39SWH1_ACESA|nr:hypothetical protein LWI29_004977 [Acer saccharum]